MSRRSAPRRLVVSVDHRSGYGRTWWLHSLECGHVERRKRKAPATSVGCVSCERETDARLAVKAAIEGPVVEFDNEGGLMQLQAAVARSLGVDVESVSLQIRPPYTVEGALVTLDARTVQKLAGLT